jgi:hypothetical protein
MDSMKTTIDIPESDLEEALRHTGARTKRDAVVTAIEEFNRKRRLEKIAARLGTFENVMTAAELVRLRRDGHRG